MAGVNPRRSYSSPLRDRRAASTRRAVLAAARELFVERGYGATTIEDVAHRAGVSKPTVFTAVGSKQDLLRAIRDAAIAGDDEPVPVAQRPGAAGIRDAADQRGAVRLLAEHLAGVARRYSPIYQVLQGAAASGEPELRQLWELESHQRMIGAEHWIGILEGKGPLRVGFDRGKAADVLWLLMAPDNYHRMVHGRGWTHDTYQQWLADAITALLFATDAPARRGERRAERRPGSPR